jgi:translocation and assembly module TamA
LSQVDSEITGAYRWPIGRPTAEWAVIYGGLQDKETDTSHSEKSTLGIRMSRNRSTEWLETPYLEFTYEDFIVGEQVDSSRLIIPGITWERTIGRDLRRVDAGHRISFDLRGAFDKLGSDTTFLQATVSTKWIWSPGSLMRILARADLGATAKDSLDDLPATVRFFAGGDTSVRGYDFETIGPVDDNGDVTGGSHLIAVSLEADWKIASNWAIAAFVDSGSAFDDSAPDFKTGLGLGLRWYSPLGPIRVDFAHPLDDPDENFRLHITLGPDL